MSTEKPKDLEDAFKILLKEGQGVWIVDVVTKQESLALTVWGLLEPTSRAAGLLRLFMQAIDSVRSRHPLCLFCETEFSTPDDIAALVALTPAVDRLEHGVVNVLCAKCASRTDLMAAIPKKYKESIFPDLRVVSMPSEPSRA